MFKSNISGFLYRSTCSWKVPVRPFHLVYINYFVVMNLFSIKMYRVFTIFCIFSILLASCSEKAGQSALQRQADHVIVIGVDGMSPDGIVNAATPVIDQLMAEGSFTLNARSVLPTSSSTNWASMVSGAGPEQHGITSNDWERDDYILPPVSTGTEDIFPTIFSVTKAANPQLQVGAVYHWEGFGRLIERSVLDYDKHGENEEVTVQLAREYIRSKKPDFLFIHLDHVDHAGHHYGHKTQGYYDAVAVADKLIGDIFQSAKDAEIYDETIFIIAADHGGIGYGHGGETLDEIEIPFIIFGKNIKKGHLIEHNVYQYDNAATVAFALGIEQPYAWIGKPVKSAFLGYVDPPVFGDAKVRITPPVIQPKPNLYEVAGGLYIDEPAELIIESTPEVEVRYTLDGTEPSKNSALYSGPVPITKSTVVMAKAFGDQNEESASSKAYFRIVTSGKGNGVQYKYYEGKGWKFLPVFSTLKPIKSGTGYQIRIDDINERDGQFAIKYSTYLEIDKAGAYKFYVTSDDGSKLYINGELITDNDGDHGAIERSGTIELEEGRAHLEVEYLNVAGGWWLDAWYKGPGIPKQIIPADKLFLDIEK